jgi:hypothetical protein
MNYYTGVSYTGTFTSTSGMLIPLNSTALKAAGMYRNDITAYYRDGKYVVTFNKSGENITLSGDDLKHIYEAYDAIQNQVHVNKDIQTRILTEAMIAIKTAQTKAERKKTRQSAPKPIIPLIGDEERNKAVSWLSDAFADGKLLLDEFNTRMDRAMAARHQNQLDKLTQDLGPRKLPVRKPAEVKVVKVARSSGVSIPAWVPAWVFILVATICIAVMFAIFS